MTASVSRLTDKVMHKLITIKLVNTDAVLNGHRDVYRCLHVLDQSGNCVRLCHEASADFVVLDSIGWAADVDIDFIITVLLSQLCTAGHLADVRPAKL